MRIAYVTETYPPELNGVALSVERAIQYLRSRGHAVDLIRPRQPCDPEHRRDAGTLLVPGLPIPMYQDLRMGMPATAAIARRWRARRPDVVHVATEGPLGWAAVRTARRMGLPVTSDFRTNFHEYSRHYRLGLLEPVIRGYLRRFHNRTETTFVPTGALRATLEADGFERLAVVSRGVDTRRFTPERRSRALRAKWGATDDTPVLLYVGRLAAEKNVPLALAAFDAAREAAPDTRMVVVGDGPLRARFAASRPDVRFTGALGGETLAAHYASADVFLFPSLTETFGNVTIEAMASGLAVVAFRHAAAGALIISGRNGLVVEPSDDDGFVRRAAFLAANANWTRRFGARARATALERSWDDVLARFERALVVAAHADDALHERPVLA